ncbi:MAG TPA: transcriptional repressor [Thermoanaerobaculia bacterium]|nr:transcriptional repressor [Thermoanaerobaculia bacterium]
MLSHQSSQRSERDTQQRRAIRSAIERADRPLSPREVLDQAEPQSPGLGIATVYRTLKSGVEGGWLQAVELPGEAPRYEPTGKEHHHHFHCRSCDRVYEIEGCPDDLRHLTPPGFALEAHEIVLYGRCAECAR